MEHFENFKTMILSSYNLPSILSNDYIDKREILGLFDRWGFCFRDLINTDLSMLSLENITEVNFDPTTRWPMVLPKGFDPTKCLENGKRCGLNIDFIHEQGITGKGINVAIIDFPFNMNHIEVQENIMEYNLLEDVPNEHFHGITVSSLFVGRSVRIAPDANLYFYAFNGGVSENFSEKIIEALQQIYKHNQICAEKDLIKVISLSASIHEKFDEEREELSEKLSKQGCYLIDSPTFSKNFTSGKIKYNHNRDDHNEYTLNKWQMESAGMINFMDKILVPGGGRTSSLINTDKEYMYYANASYSWSIPQLAGIFALTLQINSEITYEQFVKIANETKKTNDNGLNIINPEHIIKKVLHHIHN